METYARGIPTYKGENGQRIGLLCETKEQCITDDDGVRLSDKLARMQEQIGVAPDLAGYATETYVDNSVSGLASEEYVDSAVSGLATKAELEEYTKAIESGTTAIGNAEFLDGLTAKEVGVSGVRNLIPYPYHETTHTDNGITWTDNGDGTVTANGTATDNSDFYLRKTVDKFELAPGIYTLSPGCDGCSEYTYLAMLRAYSKSESTFVKDFIRTSSNKLSAEITQEDSDSYYFLIFLYIKSAQTVENLTFKPMLELGSIAHSYVPYYFGGAENALKVGGKVESELSVASADTVDGYHATDFMLGKTGYGVDVFKTHDLNDWIISGTYCSQEGDSNVPSGTDGWGDVLVFGSQNDHKTQIYRTWNSLGLYWRRMFGTGVWSDWIKLAKATDLAFYLPLDGSVSMSGMLKIDMSEPKIRLLNDVGDTAELKFQGDCNLGLSVTDADGSSCSLSIMPSKGTGKMARFVENGNVYTALHTGNSNQTVVVDTDPGVGASVSYSNGTLIFVKGA